MTTFEPEQPPEQPPPEQPPPGPQRYSIRGQDVSEDDLVSLLEFQNWAEAHPEQMQAFGSYLRGEAQFVLPEQKPPEQPAQPQLPEVDWEAVDPNVRKVYEQQQQTLESMQQRIAQFEEPLQQVQATQWETARQEAEAALDLASGRIQDRFKLNEDELEELAVEAARLQIVPSLRAQGMAPEAALETALETAFWRSDKWRSRAVDEALASRNAGTRRELAGKIGGTSASTGDGLGSPQPTPSTEGERRTAMAAEIAEALRGTP